MSDNLPVKPVAGNDNLPDKPPHIPAQPGSRFAALLIAPGDYIKQHILPKIRGPEYPYYHRIYRRVPTVEACKADDHACIWEANEQYKRDRHVDKYILNILRSRKEECFTHWAPDQEFKCQKEIKDEMEAERNWQIKHGDLGISYSALNAFYKQKHRMVYERRHGPVGEGRKPPSQWKKTWEPSMHSATWVRPED